MKNINKPPESKVHEGYGEAPSKVYNRYLSVLELQESDIVGKRILDIGAGSAGFAAGAKEKGLDTHIVSVDDNPLTDRPHTIEGYVRAEAQKLPFADNTFDMVVSVYALPQVAAVGKVKSHDQRSYEKAVTASTAHAVRECIRVVKEGGEIRFGGVPVVRNENTLDDEGFPLPPFRIENDAADKGFKEGSEREFLAKYPDTEKERLYIVRKRHAEERPWETESNTPGAPVHLDEIEIHPEIQNVMNRDSERNERNYQTGRRTTRTRDR